MSGILYHQSPVITASISTPFGLFVVGNLALLFVGERCQGMESWLAGCNGFT